MGWYWRKRKKKKWKPGFWVYVNFDLPGWREVTLRLHVTPESFTRWVLREGVCRGSGEAQSFSDISFKNSCQCQKVGQNGQNKANSASKRGFSGENTGFTGDIH